MFRDFAQVEFWDGQKAENEFAGPVDHLKHRFLDIAQVAFWSGQKAPNECAGPGDPKQNPFSATHTSQFVPLSRLKMNAQG
jgi:hypothetical protein